ncbi:MAG: GH3 auxin-responsive promoter family protein [Saprospiraceae bacterium]
MKKQFNVLIKHYLKHRFKRISAMRSHPIQEQERVLKSLVYRAKNTSYGKKYNFKKIRSLVEYNNALPLTNYEDVKGDIFEMMDGKKNMLWPGEIRSYAKSSGTTNDRSKYLPVSKDSHYKNHVSSTWDTMSIIYNEDPQSQIFWKKSLVMGGTVGPWKHNTKTKVGDISAILLGKMPTVGVPFYTPDFETALLADWEQKISRMTDICADEDVVMFGGVPTWSIVLFKKILEYKKASNMLEVWPNARYYVHGGVSFSPYIDQFKNLFPDPKFKYYEVYNASEGYFSLQDRADKKGMLLLLKNDIYYEFIPINEMQDENPTVLELKDVEVHQNYIIVISTSAGLWRYIPGDTVVFTSIYPFRIMVSGRTNHFINVFGEEVIVSNTDKALEETTKTLTAIVTEYTVGPIFLDVGQKGGHHWLIEFEKKPEDINAFEKLLDKNLQNINSDYAAKRYKDMALKRLTIRPVPTGTFHKWMASKGKFGGQNKVPRLYNDTKYIDQIMNFVRLEK